MLLIYEIKFRFIKSIISFFWVLNKNDDYFKVLSLNFGYHFV